MLRNSNGCAGSCNVILPPESDWAKPIRKMWEAIARFWKRQMYEGAIVEARAAEIRRAHEMFVNMNGYRF